MPRVVIVDGVIGAGKSVLLSALAEGLRACGKRVVTIQEPVDEWGFILPSFYQSPARYAYSFQTLIYATRVARILDAWEHGGAGDADVVLLERSPATDRIFMELQRSVVDPLEMKCYDVWCDTYQRVLPFRMRDATVLYVSPSMDACMHRVNARSRDGETSGGVTREYQLKLARVHEAFLLNLHRDEFPSLASPFSPQNVHVLAQDMADKNFRDEGEERRLVVQHIIDLLLLR